LILGEPSSENVDAEVTGPVLMLEYIPQHQTVNEEEFGSMWQPIWESFME
jgi:hypothetical protein